MCPIVLAIQRPSPGCRVMVLPSRIEYISGGVQRALNVPSGLRTFILAFGRGDKLEPFSFELPVEQCDHENR